MSEEGPLPWVAFTKGETALDFGSYYLFANPQTREIGAHWSHQAPAAATWCVKLAAVLDTVPSAKSSASSSETRSGSEDVIPEDEPPQQTLRSGGEG